MKINKIIISSFLGLIVLFLLILTIAGFAYQNKETSKEHSRNTEIEKETIKLEACNHLYVGDDCKINLYGSDNNKIEYSTNITKPAIQPLYEVRNDTLFIVSSKTNLNDWSEVYANQFESVTCQNGRVSFHKLNQDKLRIIGDHSTLHISNNSNVFSADIILKNKSDFQGWNYNGKELNLDITSSKVQFSSNHKLNSIKGTVSENSVARLPKVKNINVESDESSEVKIY